MLGRALRGTTWSTGPDEFGRPNRGYTTFNGSPDTVRVYVSSSTGNDTWDGLFPDNSQGGTHGPVATFQMGITKLAALGQIAPNHLLFKRADSFIGGASGTGVGQNNVNIFGGRSRYEPMLFGTYGTGARPTFSTGGVDTGFFHYQATRGQFVAFQGLKFYNDLQDPGPQLYTNIRITGDLSTASKTITNVSDTSKVNVGMTVTCSGVVSSVISAVTVNSITISAFPTFNGTTVPLQVNQSSAHTGNSVSALSFGGGVGGYGQTFVFVEDCEFRFCGISLANVLSYTPADGPSLPDIEFRIRRNIIDQAYTDTGGIGMFLGGNSPHPQQSLGRMVLDWDANVVSSNGWHKDIWNSPGNIFSHNYYLHDPQAPMLVRENITFNPSASAGEVRNGGTVYNNLAIQAPASFGSNPGFNNNVTQLDYNVCLNASDIICGYRTATAASAAGTSTLFVDGILTSGNGVFTGCCVTNLTNPGSLVTVSASLNNATVNSIDLPLVGNDATGHTVKAGQRGDGVQPGDILMFYAARGWGMNFGPTGTIQPVANAQTLRPSAGTGVCVLFVDASGGPGIITSDSTLATTPKLGPNAPITFAAQAINATAIASDGSVGSRITVASTSGMVNGQTWTLSSFTGTTGLNGSQVISNVTGTTYDVATVAFVATGTGTATGALPTGLVATQIYFMQPDWRGGSKYWISDVANGNPVVFSGTAVGNPTRTLYASSNENSTNTPVNATVTMTVASPCVVTDTGTAPVNAGNPNFLPGAPISFSTTGTLPTDLATGQPLSGTYYVRNSKNGGTTYNISSTPTGPLITTTGSQSGTHTRLGTTTYQLPWNAPLPAWMTTGMNATILKNGASISPYFASGSFTTITSIRADRLEFTLASPLVAAMALNYQSPMCIWATGDASNLAANEAKFNIHANSVSPYPNGPAQGIALGGGCQNVDASHNYFYNWCTSTANNLQDAGGLGGLGVANTVSADMNLAGSSAHPHASIEYYDATLRTDSFVGSISGFNGTVISGTVPALYATLFDLSADGIAQYTQVVWVSGSSFRVNISQSFSGTIQPGSADHFVKQAGLNRNGSYDQRYSAYAANNAIRTALGLATI